jgi:acetate kinase
VVSIDDSPIKICVVTTDEEMRIARETDALVSGEDLHLIDLEESIFA